MEVTKVARASNALMILTSAHHAYGAYVYSTPWRLHILVLSVPVFIVTLLLHPLLKKDGYSSNRFLYWIYWLVVFVASVVLIGGFEGVYNHLLKNILFFAGIEHHILMSLFPPPTYEMPNDILFELTGVGQAIIWIFLVIRFVKMTTGKIR